MISKIKKFFSNKINNHYLIIGSLNTLVGYIVGVMVYNAISTHYHIIAISIISNLICITFSFYTIKKFVFKSKNNWINEYLKSNISYISIFFISTSILWIFVDILKIDIIYSQGIVIIISAVLSYSFNFNYTFKK